jgi:anti-sigma28 factor (negative regulator of flagellin synthesis)
MNPIHLNGNLSGAQEADSTRAARRTDAGREAESNPSAAGNTSANADALNLSERGAKVAQLVSRIAEMPDVRSERVELLSRMIGADAYRPSAREIADALLRADN